MKIIYLTEKIIILIIIYLTYSCSADKGEMLKTENYGFNYTVRDSIDINKLQSNAIKKILENVNNRKTTSLNIKINESIIYTFNENPAILAVKTPVIESDKEKNTTLITIKNSNIYIFKEENFQFGYNLKITHLPNGYIAEYSDLNNNKLIKYKVINSRITDASFYETKISSDKSWVDCMKRGIRECYNVDNDLICTIVCTIAAPECMIGFSLGCLF